MRHALSLHLLSLLCLCCLALPAQATLYRVGAVSDGNCTHQSIQDALDAAAVDPVSYDIIYVASNQSYTGQALSIDHQSVAIYGGFAQCGDNTASGPATLLDGSGNGGLPVIDVNLIGGSGFLVTLVDLDLGNGNVGAGDGGNLRIRGQGQVGVSGVIMHDGTAARGGGMYALGDDASHQINLQIGNTAFAPTTAEGNLATADGGGVYCDQFCFLGINSIRVADNDAQRGGGVFMAGQSSMSLSAGGMVDGVETGILLNRASLDGGGLYADTGSSPSTARYVEPNDPPRIAGNQAGRDGGGVYLTGNGTFLLGGDLQLVDNKAGAAESGRGGGLYVGNGASTLLYDQNDNIRCGVTAPCVAINGNSAGILGHIGFGGGVFVNGNSTASIAYAQVTGNSATDGAAMAASGSSATLSVGSSILTANAGPHSVLLEASSQGQLSGITIAEESSTDALIKVSFATITLHTSILYDPGTAVLALDGPTTVSSTCVLSHDDFDMVGDVRTGNPEFLDAAGGDFRLGDGSLALDACAAGPFAVGDRDYSEAPRGLDLPDVPDIGGPFDLGAYEKQLPPEVFTDGFESP